MTTSSNEFGHVPVHGSGIVVEPGERAPGRTNVKVNHPARVSPTLENLTHPIGPFRRARWIDHLVDLIVVGLQVELQQLLQGVAFVRHQVISQLPRKEHHRWFPTEPQLVERS